MHTIEVEFDVLKALMAQRDTEAMSYSDVIRDLLQKVGKLPMVAGQTKTPSLPAAATPSIDDWICKGVRFPAGTEFRANYKDQIFYAKVERGGLVVDGTRTTSPSDAARVITKNAVNGWLFWECRFPGESRWKLIKSLRKSR